MRKIIAISGSLRKESYTTKMLLFLASQAPADFEVELLDIAYLPLLNTDLEENLPESIVSLHSKIREADAILLGEPEYNRSITSPMKNALDWGTRPEGTNVWESLPAAVIGSSPSRLGAYGAVTHLRQVMMHIGLITMTQPEIYFSEVHKMLNEDGLVSEERFLKQISRFWVAFEQWILKHGK